MRNGLGMLLAALCMPMMAGAADMHALPESLMYKGSPVADSCIAELFSIGDSVNSVNLAVCSAKPLEADEDVMYKYLGKRRDAELLLVYYSGGGSGQFSQLMGLARKGDTLSVKERIEGGDRCHGSIEAAIISDSKLIVTKRVTPRMVWDLSGEKTSALYEGLDDSAISCVGLAKYVNGKFVSLVPDGSDTQWVLDEDEQDCFRQHLRRQPPKIKADKLKDFIHDYSAVCAAKQE